MRTNTRKREALHKSQSKRARLTAREQEAKADARKGILMIIVAALIAGIFFLYAITRDQVSLDAQSCVIGQQLKGHTIFLIDGTDEISGEYINRFRSQLDLLKNTLPVGEKLTLVRLSGNENSNPEFKTVFSQCNPGQGSQFAGINESKKKKQAEWTIFFGEPLNHAVSELESLEVGKSSPILESINRLTFRPDFDPSVKNRKIIIVSDLMHHTEDLSHYSNSYGYAGYRELGEPYSNVPLRDVEVHIIYVKRDKLKGFQDKHHRQFWEQYFEENGAKVEAFR